MNSAQPTNSLAAPSTTYTALKLLQHALIQCLTLDRRELTSREKKPQQQQQHHHKHLFISSCTHTSIKAVTHSQSVCLTNCFALISFLFYFFSASGDNPACSALQLVPNAVKMTHFQTVVYKQNSK